MSTPPKLTLADLFLSLRHSLLNAIEHDDKGKLQELKITFSNLVEEAYTSEDSEVISILVALEDAARDALIGVQWKSDIPSIEAITKALE